jgi:hypothetical protein
MATTSAKPTMDALDLLWRKANELDERFSVPIAFFAVALGAWPWYVSIIVTKPNHKPFMNDGRVAIVANDHLTVMVRIVSWPLASGFDLNR